MRNLHARNACLIIGTTLALVPVNEVVAQERPAARGTLAGVVRDTTARPLAMVQVVVAADTNRTALTDTSGAYHIGNLPSGIHRVSFRRLGFVPAEFHLLVLAGEVRRAVVELVAAPVLLDSVTIADSNAATYPVLHRTGFFDRMRMRQEGAGVGRFVTPEELERVRALTKTTHILETAGVRMIQVEQGLSLWPVGAANIILRGGSPPLMGPCQMALFINGAEIFFGRYYDPGTGPGVDAFIQPTEIRAIEIYSSASGTPIQFQSVRNALCGSIVIWTK